MIRIFLNRTLCLMLLGFAMSNSASAQSGLADPRQAANVFVAATAAGDAGAIAALYAPDALLLAPGAAPIRGREAIRATNQQHLQRGRSTMQFTDVSADIGPDRAAVLWSWVLETAMPDGSRQRSAGRSLVYFKRSAEGWLISADMFQPMRG